MKPNCTLIGLALALFAPGCIGAPCIAGTRKAPAYAITDIGTLGGSSAYPFAIDDNGEVAGYASLAGDSAFHAFLYDGTMHDLGTLGGTYSFGYAINADGAVVGSAYLPGDSASHAFLYDGTMHDLGTLGGSLSEATGINANEQVIGFSSDADGNFTAFFYDGSLHALSLGGSFSQATGINDTGQVAGYGSLPGDTVIHAFLYDGQMHDLGTLGGSYSYASGINSKGQVVGYSFLKGDTQQHAFVYGEKMRDLGTLGGTYSQANAINDAGEITGSSTVAGDVSTDTFRYNGEMHDVGTLGGSASAPNAINIAGQIVGSSTLAGDQVTDTFLYSDGLYDLATIVPANSGWTFAGAVGINARAEITGNISVNGLNHAFLLSPDTKPPRTSIQVTGKQGEDGWYVGPVQVTLSATDSAGGSGVAATYFSLDAGATANLYTVPFNLTTDGIYEISYWSVDKAGNKEKPKTRKIKIDASSPVIEDVSVDPAALTAPANQMATATVHYRVSDTVDPASWIECRLSVSANEAAGEHESSPDYRVLDAHHVLLRAERAGNQGHTGLVYTITITCTNRAGNSAHTTVTAPVQVK